jgi:nuclear pore complex protein Nup54
MFGAPAPAAGGSLFGSAPATGGLFGAAPATPAGGLFGQPAQTGGGLFGASQAPAAGGLFGAPPATPSLFGAPQQPTSLFGASQPAATPSLFGAPAASGSLFGAPPATPSLFGAPPAPATSLFGQSQPSLFGQPTVNPTPLFGQSQPAASSLFGAKPSLFGTSSLAQSTAPLVPRLGDPYPPPNPDDPSIESRIEAIKAAWDPTTPRCQFQTYFYNMPAPPNTVAQYNSPPVGLDPKAWARAVRENPDPEQ